MTRPVTEGDLMKIVDVLRAMAEVVNASGPMGLPSGELYARVMHTMSLETYERIIGLMVAAGAIRRQNHLLLPRGAR